jgi:hypothetical protein
MEPHMKKLLLLACFAPLAVAANTPIQGTVESKCVIQTDTTGVYGNPSPSVLSTDPTAGGVNPIVRYDILAAVTNWSGDIKVGQTSDALMSGFETNKVSYNNTVEFDLTVAGSVWFNIDSAADYGYDKSFPAGDYTAMVVAECIAQ